jgi:homogentisate 1,2-dioxygenase
MLSHARGRAVLYSHKIGSFGGIFTSEALPGAVPRHQNSPQQCKYNLFAELISGNSFTAPRAVNRYSWMYRLRPSVVHQPKKFEVLENQYWTTKNTLDTLEPIQYRFSPLIDGKGNTKEFSNNSFGSSIFTVAVNGTGASQDGAAASVFAFTGGDKNEFLKNIEAETLLIPFEGSLEVATEFGKMKVHPMQFCIIPRGVVFSVLPSSEGSTKTAKGYMLENFGSSFQLPELGPIGISSGLAHPRHFEAPDAEYVDEKGDFKLIVKSQDKLFSGKLEYSPLDVVGWYGSHVPLVYDMRRFVAINTVTFDHPDPCIGSVLASPTAIPGVSNIDFVIFPPRYLVAENTLRVPWFHRNYMSEFMGLVRGEYDAKSDGFLPGGCSIHNKFIPHGPDADAFLKSSQADTGKVERYEKTLAFMWESDKVWKPTQAAMRLLIDDDYTECWNGFRTWKTTSPLSSQPDFAADKFPFNPDKKDIIL